MSTAQLTLELPDEQATEALGTRLSRVILSSLKNNEINKLDTSVGAAVYLSGDLGAGKTALARALLRAAGVTGRIKSPSYALLESYKVSSLYFYHIDFYRFGDSREWEDAGFRDLFSNNAIILIEWPEKAAGHLPPPDLLIELAYADPGRTARITTQTKRGVTWLTSLNTEWSQRPSASPSAVGRS